MKDLEGQKGLVAQSWEMLFVRMRETDFYYDQYINYNMSLSDDEDLNPSDIDTDELEESGYKDMRIVDRYFN